EAQREAELAEMRARLSAVSGSPPKEPPEKHVDEFEKLIDDFEDAINYSEKRVDDSEEPIEAAAAAPDVSGDAVEPSER
ncbi:MAG: hypothetical protein LBT60_05805, partial [Oscillospiraceae bacterium]|nr:hypothetical protein [Oscillospiraceae bacterium]